METTAQIPPTEVIQPTPNITEATLANPKTHSTNDSMMANTNTAIGVVLGLITLVGIIWAAGKAWGTITESFKTIKERLDNDVLPDLKEIKTKVNMIEPRVEVLWEERVAISHSPRELNQRGIEILDNSGIKTVLDEHKDEFLAQIQALEIGNVYDAESTILDLVSHLPETYPQLSDSLKLMAYRTGVDLDTLLLVGGLYLRNEIFPTLGYNLADLDGHE